MKTKLLLSCAFVLIATIAAWSQPGQVMGERVKSMHAAYITDRLRLTPEESQAFWPIYNEYKDQERVTRQSYKATKAPDQLTEEEAAERIQLFLQMEQEVLDLRAEYTARLQTVVPASKLVLLNIAEREFKERLVSEMQNRRQDRQPPRRRRN